MTKTTEGEDTGSKYDGITIEQSRKGIQNNIKKTLDKNQLLKTEPVLSNERNKKQTPNESTHEHLQPTLY